MNYLTIEYYPHDKQTQPEIIPIIDGSEPSINNSFLRYEVEDKDGNHVYVFVALERVALFAVTSVKAEQQGDGKGPRTSKKKRNLKDLLSGDDEDDGGGAALAATLDND